MKPDIYEAINIWNQTSLKLEIYETRYLWNQISIMPDIYETRYLWNKIPRKTRYLWNKIHVKPDIYETRFLRNQISMKPDIYETRYLWNQISMKPDIYETRYLWNQISMKLDIYGAGVNKKELSLEGRLSIVSIQLHSTVVDTSVPENPDLVFWILSFFTNRTHRYKFNDYHILPRSARLEGNNTCSLKLVYLLFF